MIESVNFPVGSIVLLDKVEKDFGFFDFMFKGIDGKAKNFKETIKSLVYKKLTESLSITQIPKIYPKEAFEYLGLKKHQLNGIYIVLSRGWETNLSFFWNSTNSF